MPDQVQIVEIPCGQGGLNSSELISNYPITDLKTAENLSYEDDTWRKEGGASKINSVAFTGAPTITGLWEFFPTEYIQKRIAGTSDGKIVSFGASGIVDTLASGLGANKQFVFSEAYGTSNTRKLFIFNNYDAVKVTSDGVTASDITKPPTDWAGTNQPISGVVHNGRLWGFGNPNAPHRIYYSVLTDHENFQDAGSGTIQCYPGEGEKLVGGVSFAGRLYLFKYPRGVYWVNDTDTDVANWGCKRLTNSVGLAGPLALTQVDNDVIFVSVDGFIYSLSAVQEYGESASIKTAAIMVEKIGNWLRNNVALSRIQKCVALYYPSKKELHIAYTQSGKTYNNVQLILEGHNIQNLRFRVNTRDACESMALTRDANYVYRPMVGDNAGFVRILDNSTRNKDGGAYTGKFETADIPLIEKGSRRANLQYLETIFKPFGDYYLTVDIYRDGIYSNTVNVYMGTSGGRLDSFVLGTDVLGGGTVLNTRNRLIGDCRRIKLIGYNSGVNEDFSISGFLVGYTIGNEMI